MRVTRSRTDSKARLHIASKRRRGNGGAVPTRIQVEEALEDGEARICVFLSGGLFREPFAKVFSAELEHADALN